MEKGILAHMLFEEAPISQLTMQPHQVLFPAGQGLVLAGCTGGKESS